LISIDNDWSVATVIVIASVVLNVAAHWSLAKYAGRKAPARPTFLHTSLYIGGICVGSLVILSNFPISLSIIALIGAAATAADILALVLAGQSVQKANDA
jgi:hypothetical protein